MFKRHRFVVVSVGEQALGGPTLPLASCGQTSAPAGASGRLGPPPGVKLWLRHQSWGSDDGRNAVPMRASCALPTATGWSVNQRVCPGDRDSYMKLHGLPAKRKMQVVNSDQPRPSPHLGSPQGAAPGGSCQPGGRRLRVPARSSRGTHAFWHGEVGEGVTAELPFPQPQAGLLRCSPAPPLAPLPLRDFLRGSVAVPGGITGFCA